MSSGRHDGKHSKGEYGQDAGAASASAAKVTKVQEVGGLFGRAIMALLIVAIIARGATSVWAFVGWSQLAFFLVLEGMNGFHGTMNEHFVRAGKGLITIQCSKRNGDLVGILAASDDRELMMVTSGGVIMRTGMDQISRIGRNTQGVRLIDLGDGMQVVRAVGLKQLEEELEEAQHEGLDGAGEEVDEEAIAAAESAVDGAGDADDDPAEA